MSDTFDVIIVGGGPAGMMAAISAARCGKSVLLIEKNSDLGKKLLITGKGRCNITNDAPIDEFYQNIPTNPRFLYSAFSALDNSSLIDFFEQLGVKTKVERGRRVFPVSDKAVDVRDALKKRLIQLGVSIKQGTVLEVECKQDRVHAVKLKNGGRIITNSIVLATGGYSYPRTGSTGDGHEIAKRLGHTVTQIEPSLVPLVAKENWVNELQGLSLKNVDARLISNGKLIKKEFGEMLFTHFGLSGPIILSLSTHLKNCGQESIMLDLKPALTKEQLDKRLQRDFEKFANRDFINALDELLPKKMIPVIVALSNILPHKKVHQISREERVSFCRLLKELSITISGKRPIEEAIITSGGISVKEINPSTMESKIVSGLYFAGEMIDVDAYTGGFNLQIAFSTGYLAGMNI